MSNPEKTLLEFLQQETRGSHLQKNFDTSNQNLLFFISFMFEKNLTKEQEQEKQLKLAELSLEKQRIDKEIANLQNPEQKNQLTEDGIKSNYFNGLIEICIEFLGNENEIIQEIQEAEDNLIFENLFKQNKETKVIKEVFSKDELNSKYDPGIASFNSKICSKIENSEQYQNLSQDEQDQISSNLNRIFGELRFKTTQLRNQKKANINQENKPQKTLQELQEEHNQVINKINQIYKDLEPNIDSEEAKKIIEEIFLKLSIIQNNYNALSYEEKHKLKVSYRKNFYNKINDEVYDNFISQLKLTATNPIASYFFNPYEFFKKINKIEHSIDFSNSQFREQMILALNKVCEFYKIEKEFKYNFNFISDDQIFPNFVAYKLNTLKIANTKRLIHISKEIIEDDKKFKEFFENTEKYFEEYQKKINEIINNVSDGIKNEFGVSFYQIIGVLNDIGGIDFIRECFNLDKEKIEAYVKFGTIGCRHVLSELNDIGGIDFIREFFKLDKEKIEVCAKFGAGIFNFGDILWRLNDIGGINLVEKFLDIIEKSDSLDEINNVIKNVLEKKDNNIKELKEYIENYKLPEPKTELNLCEDVKIVSGKNFSKIGGL